MPAFRFLTQSPEEQANSAPIPVYFHCPGCPEGLDAENRPLNLKPLAEAKSGLVLPHDDYQRVWTLCKECAKRAEEEAGHQHGKDTFVCEQCRGVTRVPGVLLCPQFVPGHEHYGSHKLNQPLEKYMLCEACARPTLEECAARWKKMQEAKK